MRRGSHSCWNIVLGEDFLRAHDGDDDRERVLATYSGDVFPHSVVFENQSSLILRWTSLNLNSDKGFKVHYFTDRMDRVTCLNDCDRVGVCASENLLINRPHLTLHTSPRFT